MDIGLIPNIKLSWYDIILIEFDGGTIYRNPFFDWPKRAFR